MTPAETAELAILERWTIAMSIPMGCSAVLVVLPATIAAASAMFYVGSLVLIPVAMVGFTLLPMLLVFAAGVVGLAGTVKPDLLPLALRIQWVFWCIVLVQGLAFVMLLSLGGVAAVIFGS